ncbi:MAG: hypothetical protein L0Z73_03220 [Gammaproteobacteria bacterium]|nr:hypothetical protein [Gammaproteobacteria bacterium]
MNAIKSALVCVLVLLTFSCYAAGKVQLTWKPDGTVFNTSGRSIKLNVQNIYTGKTLNDALYLAGFRIDKEGINHPVVARIAADLNDTAYWNFDTMPQDFFLFDSKVHVNDSSGKVFTLNNSNWESANISLKPNSSIITTNSDIVACYPSSKFKAVKDTGVCYSVTKNWNVTVNWIDRVPQICGKQIHAFENNFQNPVVKVIDIDTGKILKTKSVKSPPENLCDFN